MLVRPRLLALLAPRLWTPDQGSSGILVLPPPQALATVIGGRIIMAGNYRGITEAPEQREWFQATPGGLFIVSSSRKREPARTIGHPDLASGASVQRGDVLYVSIAEAVYRESRGEAVELHFESTQEDNDALRELRLRARNRWENDRLPDGWTRPLPPPPTPKTTEMSDDQMSDDLSVLRAEFLARQEHLKED